MSGEAAPSSSPAIQSRRSIKTTAARWAETADPEFVKALSEDEVQRQEILHELITTEAEYVKSLNVVVELFLHPLREKAVLKRHEIFSVFGPYESILVVNKPLLEELKRIQSTSIVPQDQLIHVAETFCRRADEFRVYGPYCGMITSLQENVATLQRTNEAFDKFLAETSKRPECKRLLLSDFLIEPLQRLVKYPLLLVSLKKLTPESHAAHKPIVDAHSRMSHVADIVNETTHMADSMRKMETLENELKANGQDVTIRQNGRKLLRDGIAKLVTAKKKSTEGYLYLFSDMLLVCRLHKGKKRLEKRLPFLSDTIPPMIVLRCADVPEGQIGGQPFVLELCPMSSNPSASTPATSSSSSSVPASTSSAPQPASSSSSVPSHVISTVPAGDPLMVQFASNAEKSAWLAELHNRIREKHDEETRLSMLVTRLPTPSAPAPSLFGQKDPKRLSTQMRPGGDYIAAGPPPSAASSSGAVNTVLTTSNVSVNNTSSVTSVTSLGNGVPLKSALKQKSSYSDPIASYSEFLFESNQRLQRELNREIKLREALEGYCNTLRMRLERVQNAKAQSSSSSSSSSTVPRDKYKQLKRKYADLQKEKSALESRVQKLQREHDDAVAKPNSTSASGTSSSPNVGSNSRAQVERGFSIMQLLSPRSSRANAGVSMPPPASSNTSVAPNTHSVTASPATQPAKAASSNGDMSVAEAEFIARMNATGWKPDPRKLPRNHSTGTAATSKAAKERDAISMRVQFYETLGGGTPTGSVSGPSPAAAPAPANTSHSKRSTVAGVSPVPSGTASTSATSAARPVGHNTSLAATSTTNANTSTLGGSIGRGAQRRSGQFNNGLTSSSGLNSSAGSTSSNNPHPSTATSSSTAASPVASSPNFLHARAAPPASFVNMNAAVRSPSPRHPSALVTSYPNIAGAPTSVTLMPVAAPTPAIKEIPAAADQPQAIPGTQLALSVFSASASSTNSALSPSRTANASNEKEKVTAPSSRVTSPYSSLRGSEKGAPPATAYPTIPSSALSPRQQSGTPPVPSKPPNLQLTSHTLASKQDDGKKERRMSLREPLKEPPAPIRVPNPTN